jgi:putative efflux protein, MATE family
MKWTENWRMILWLAIPSIISFASQTLSGTLNLMIVGRLEGGVAGQAIAIVGVSNVIIYNVWAIFSGIGHTVNYLVAQNIGAGETKKAIERTYIALYVTALVALFVLAAGWLFADELLRIVGGKSAEELADGASYLRLRFYAMSCGIFSFLFHGFMRGTGDTRTPMVLSLLMNTVMMTLTYGLAYSRFGLPELGLYGAGLAFFIGELIGLVGCLFVFFVRLHPRYATRSRAKFRWNEARLILRESGKLGVQEFSISFSMLVFTFFVAYLGATALAANEVALSVMSLGFMPAFGFGSTATILVGQYIGKGKPLVARRMGTDVAVLGTIFLTLVGVLEFAFPVTIAHWYSNEPEVYELAARLIMMSAFLQLFDGLLNYYAGGLRGIGDTTFLLRVSFALGVFLFIPSTYLAIFVFHWGSVGAWLSLYFYLVVFGLLVMRRFYRTDWLSVRMKSAE